MPANLVVCSWKWLVMLDTIRCILLNEKRMMPAMSLCDSFLMTSMPNIEYQSVSHACFLVYFNLFLKALYFQLVLIILIAILLLAFCLCI